MLESVVTYTVLVTEVYIEVVADIKCQIHILHLKESVIQQRQQYNCRNLCKCFFSSNSFEFFMFKMKHPISNVV